MDTVCLARIPESKKATLKSTLVTEVEAVLAKRPELTVVKVADGAKDKAQQSIDHLMALAARYDLPFKTAWAHTAAGRVSVYHGQLGEAKVERMRLRARCLARAASGDGVMPLLEAALGLAERQGAWLFHLRVICDVA